MTTLNKVKDLKMPRGSVLYVPIPKLVILAVHFLSFEVLQLFEKTSNMQFLSLFLDKVGWFKNHWKKFLQFGCPRSHPHRKRKVWCCVRVVILHPIVYACSKPMCCSSAHWPPRKMLVTLQERTVGYTFFLRKHDTTNETAETHDSSSLFCFSFWNSLATILINPIIPMIKKEGLKWMPPHAFRPRTHWMPCFTWSYLLWRLGGPTFPTKTLMVGGFGCQKPWLLKR